ncbi:MULTISPECIES: c-type cytochrome [Cupriavidus]|uniref:Cytochrome c2 n=1 Tax=Cupriavidus taiwanensis TaxID=164546 RepID=A0A375F7V6_9BURK|nr:MULTISPECIES: cytochrome c family protein [Cupriavidus]MEC3764256.1 cytochrome c family protein [Cupriavidus sp. SS-3]SOY93138.1 Cytochrome c2 precursor [Cupriavidus taiwanensis]SOY96615.1 Cytochrome c2 precursor [Cupriavidus taiwanensis]SPA33669.1 Cytochrome c2 precursor [Cupriavidus taiwanensis]SPA54896.1 Cytochrome c2 precursor [Cupriavidus taiwanensis]
MRRTAATLLALTAFTAIPTAAMAAADLQAGKALFATRCASCHHVGRNARAGFGPQLNGIFGRTAGSTTDFQYSDAMRASKVVWSHDTLRAFVRSPGKVVPGTKMRFWGLGDDQQITDLLAYLETFK